MNMTTLRNIIQGMPATFVGITAIRAEQTPTTETTDAK
jgi:hypothetical protein